MDLPLQLQQVQQVRLSQKLGSHDLLYMDTCISVFGAIDLRTQILLFYCQISRRIMELHFLQAEEFMDMTEL